MKKLPWYEMLKTIMLPSQWYTPDPYFWSTDKVVVHKGETRRDTTLFHSYEKEKEMNRLQFKSLQRQLLDTEKERDDYMALAKKRKSYIDVISNMSLLEIIKYWYAGVKERR